MLFTKRIKSLWLLEIESEIHRVSKWRTKANFYKLVYKIQLYNFTCILVAVVLFLCLFTLLGYSVRQSIDGWTFKSPCPLSNFYLQIHKKIVNPNKQSQQTCRIEKSTHKSYWLLCLCMLTVNNWKKNKMLSNKFKQWGKRLYSQSYELLLK